MLTRIITVQAFTWRFLPTEWECWVGRAPDPTFELEPLWSIFGVAAWRLVGQEHPRHVYLVHRRENRVLTLTKNSSGRRSSHYL